MQELTNRNERYSDTTFENERELRALRMYALHKLQKDVYGAWSVEKENERGICCFELRTVKRYGCVKNCRNASWTVE